MWFRFLLVRLGFLAFFCALPFLFWPPPPVLAVFCFIMAAGIAAFGLLNPNNRIARLIVTLVVAFLPILGSLAPPNVTTEMLPHDATRGWVNFFLGWIAGGSTGTLVLICYLLTLLALIGLELFRLRLESSRSAADLQMRPIMGSSLWSFDPVVGAYVFEVQIVIVNRTSDAVSFASADVGLWGAVRGTVNLAPYDEAIMELSPAESIDVPANGEAKPYVLCVLRSPPHLRIVFRVLQTWVGRYLVPIPARLELMTAVAGVRFWAAPKQVRMPSK